MPPRSVSLLRNATLSDGRRVDVAIDGAVVHDVFEAGTAATPEAAAADPASVLDLDGYLLLTAPADPHAHLDKALSFDAVQPPFGDLGTAIEAWIAWSADVTIDNIVARAREQVLQMVANGTTAIRSHADVLPGNAARNVAALAQVRAELGHLVDLEIVALCSSFVSDAEIEEALAAGATVLGGAPHLAEDPIAELERLLAIAERHHLAVDLHTDESLDGPLTLDAYARAVRDWPRDRQYSAGHCCRLGTLESAELDAVIDEVKASDLGIISLPITNLYLQGWQHPVSTPRGLTALRALIDAGVRVGAGADNVRDPFNPVGRSDAFETASLLITAGHLTPEESWSLVSDGARSVMGLPVAGAVPGARADLVAIRAASLLEAIAVASADRLVLHGGRLIAETTLSRSLAL
ncbi:amidohydrolase family protein [Nocardioides sp.]|uniref:amidohydrolase family protein n=1 Tax=Nocardioides sp. TaxID=35761 RepID=UPI00263411B7|nr:amidohydrolase family protein [Nocardioides sp.]